MPTSEVYLASLIFLALALGCGVAALWITLGPWIGVLFDNKK